MSSGNKRETVVDFATSGPNSLAFTRTYNSMLFANSGQFSMPLGMKWMSNFDRYLEDAVGHTVKIAHRPDGTMITFTQCQ